MQSVRIDGGAYTPMPKKADKSLTFYNSAFSQSVIDKRFTVGYTSESISEKIEGSTICFGPGVSPLIGNIFSGFRFTHEFFYILRQKEREIAHLQKRVFEMSERIELLENTIYQAPVYVRVVNLEDKSLDEIKKMVLDYYNTHGDVYPDEVADALSLDLRKVIQVTDELIKNGKLEEAT